MEASSASALPWGLAVIDSGGSPLAKITDLKYAVELSGFLCPEEMEFSGSLTGTPDATEVTESLALSGILSSSAGNAEASGSLDVLPVETIGMAVIHNSRAVEFDGEVKVRAGTGGIACDYDIEGSIRSPNEGKITSFEFVPFSCEPFGTIQGCTIWSWGPVGLPWDIHAEEAEGTKFIRVSDVGFKGTLSGFLCPPEYGGGGSDLIFTPENAEEMAGMKVSGTLTTSSGNFTASGEVGITPTEQYGIG